MRGTRLSLLAGLVLLLLGAAPLQAAPRLEDRCSSRMAEASGRYLDCAMRENGRAARRGREANLDRCERKLGRMTTRALRRWGPAVCPVVNQIGGEAMTLGDQLNGLVSQMSEAVGVSDEGLSRAGAQCAAKKAKVLGQDLRCRAGALARGAYWDRPVNEAACSERRLARKLARIEKKYGGACPTRGDAGTLAARGQLALSEVTDWVAPSMQRHAGVTDPLPLQKFSDADGDGIPDDVEIGLTGTDPTHPDTDRDGRSDMVEFFHHKTDPLEYESPIATQNTEAAAKNGETPSLLQWLGVPDTPLGFILAGMSVGCAFANCNSGYSGAATRRAVDVLGGQIAKEFGVISSQIVAAQQEIDNQVNLLEERFDYQNCKHSRTKIPTLLGASSCSSDPYSVSCLYSAQTDAVHPTEGGSAVRKFFEKFGADEAQNFPLGDLIHRINSSDNGYKDTIGDIQTDCRTALASLKGGISADSNLLGGDLVYQRNMTPFLADTLHSYGAAIRFLSTLRSAQAWYYASPEVRKDAFWLAMQNQSTAAIPAPTFGANRCRYPTHPGSSRPECTKDSDCGSPYNTCEADDDLYDWAQGCDDNKVLIGGEVDVWTTKRVTNGKCLTLIDPSEEIWKEKNGRFTTDYPATVTTQAMQAMNHVCQAWALHNPDPCTRTDDSVTSAISTGHYCQQKLCEPHGLPSGSRLGHIQEYWDVGRDYLNTLLSLGAPFTNSDFVYEPTRDVMWLKDPGWRHTHYGCHVSGSCGYRGLPHSRFFVQPQGQDLSVNPEGELYVPSPPAAVSWPSRLNETKKVVATPATRAHWMGQGFAMVSPNRDGIQASALGGEKKCSKSKEHCRTVLDCGAEQTCDVDLTAPRADFAPSLLHAMSMKGGLVWPGSRVHNLYDVEITLPYGTCENHPEKSCSTRYDCTHVGTAICNESGICANPELVEGQLEGSVDQGAPCDADWQCRKRDPTCNDLSDGEETDINCKCNNNPGNSTATARFQDNDDYASALDNEKTNLACAAGWRENHLLFMGDSLHGTFCSYPFSGTGACEDPQSGTKTERAHYQSVSTGPTLGDSWGYEEARENLPAGLLGSCRTGMNDLMPYPYVREFSFGGGPLSVDYGLQDLSGGLKNEPAGFSVNIPALIDSCSNLKCNTADSTSYACPGSCAEGNSPVGLFGAWPQHPGWPSPPTPTSTYRYNAGMNLGLSCNWLNQNTGAFSRCDDPNWLGGECETRIRPASENSLNFIYRGDCDGEAGFLENVYTTSTGSACRNLKGGGDVDTCHPFHQLGTLMGRDDYCLYPIKERNGHKMTYYQNYAFPIACGSATKGCTSNSSAPSKRNWINFRQCLSFSAAPNCAHLGVQSPYLLALNLPLTDQYNEPLDPAAVLDKHYKIFPLVTPGGVASSTEMVASYAVNAFSRGFGCGSDVVSDKSWTSDISEFAQLYPSLDGPTRRELTAAQSPFLTISQSLQSADVSTNALQFMWPVIDLFAAGQSGDLLPQEQVCGRGLFGGPTTDDGCDVMKACSTSKLWCASDADCIKPQPAVLSSRGMDTSEKCVDVGPKRDGYAMVCPGARDWTLDDPHTIYSFYDASGVNDVDSCMEAVINNSDGLDKSNHDDVQDSPACGPYFQKGKTWDADQVWKVVEGCRGYVEFSDKSNTGVSSKDEVNSKNVSSKCPEHCMWALKCYDAFHSIGVEDSTRIKNVQKVVALNAENFDAQSKDPSSCCSDGQCELEIQKSLAPAIPAVFASYQPLIDGSYEDLDETGLLGKGRTCYSRDEATILKVNGLQQCFDQCHDGLNEDGSSYECNFVHYNATWCTLFPSCDTRIEDPYGGTLYSRDEVNQFQKEKEDKQRDGGLLGDANGVPPGALFGNRACSTIDRGHYAPMNATFHSAVYINNLTLSECADACAKQNYYQTRKECTEASTWMDGHARARQWCDTDSDCRDSWEAAENLGGSCDSTHYTFKCDTFSFYGGVWNHDPYHYSEALAAGPSGPTEIGTNTTCTLWPTRFWTPVSDTDEETGHICGSEENQVYVAPQGWAVWPAPKETTWVSDQVDCTNPGGDPRGRTCSRAVKESYARAFLDTGLSETQVLFLDTGLSETQVLRTGQMQQGSECGLSIGWCDASRGLTCIYPPGSTKGRCAGPEPGGAHGPCRYEQLCVKSSKPCTIELSGKDDCGEHDQCIPRGVCNEELTCTPHPITDGQYHQWGPHTSGFWMTEAWRPGGTCLPAGPTGP